MKACSVESTCGDSCSFNGSEQRRARHTVDRFLLEHDRDGLAGELHEARAACCR